MPGLTGEKSGTLGWLYTDSPEKKFFEQDEDETPYSLSTAHVTQS